MVTLNTELSQLTGMGSNVFTIQFMYFDLP